MVDKFEDPREAAIDSLMNLLHREYYTVPEASNLLNVRESALYKAAFGGELKADIVNGDVLGIKRGDLIAWVRARAFK